MAGTVNQIFMPESFQDLFSAWNRFPEAVICAGGHEFIRKQGIRVLELPQYIISLDKIEELKRISRTERYLEMGAMVKLNQIIQLGKIVPEALILCLENIAGPQVRNVATIGGNICCSNRRLDLSAPMNALDAQFELRTAQSSRWISASRFLSQPGPPALNHLEILTRLRVPLEPWTYTWYYKFRRLGSDEPGSCVLFMIKTQKNTLTNIRVVYSGKTILRERTSETILEGKRLPLNKNDAEIFMEKWRNYLSTFEGREDSIYSGGAENNNHELIKTQLLNFLDNTLTHISD